MLFHLRLEILVELRVLLLETAPKEPFSHQELTRSEELFGVRERCRSWVLLAWLEAERMYAG